MFNKILMYNKNGKQSGNIMELNVEYLSLYVKEVVQNFFDV